MLEDVYASYRRKADEINWKQYNQNELFFKCIEHENDDLYESFFAGIVCRYWGYSARTYLSCAKHVPFENCLDCIIDAIRYVLSKRVWENPSSSLYNDPTGPDKAIHIAMKRQKAIMLSKYNAKRRLSNFNTLSIDQAHENYNDSADGLLFGDISTDDHLKIFISEFFENDEYLNGLLLDCICYNITSYKPSNVIKYLRSLDKSYYDYYKENYNIDESKYKKVLKDIKNMSSKLLEIKLESLLYRLKKEGIYD